MDKTIEVVLVAVVVIATAAIMLFIVTGESGNFSDFVSEQISGAEEDLESHQGVNCGELDASACSSQPGCSWNAGLGGCTSAD